jgi:hypothetical protein
MLRTQVYAPLAIAQGMTDICPNDWFTRVVPLNVECWFCSGTREACALAFSKVKSDFIKSALRPFVGLREPKVFAVRVR